MFLFVIEWIKWKSENVSNCVERTGVGEVGAGHKIKLKFKIHCTIWTESTQFNCCLHVVHILHSTYRYKIAYAIYFRNLEKSGKSQGISNLENSGNPGLGRTPTRRKPTCRNVPKCYIYPNCRKQFRVQGLL